MNNPIVHNLVRGEVGNALSILPGMFSTMSDHVAAFDMDYCYLAFNEAYQQEFEKLFGHRVKEGMNLKNALADFPEDLESALQLIDRGLRGESFTAVVTFGKESPRFFESSFDSLRDENGQIIGTFLVGRDITPWVQTEHALEEVEKRFQAIFDNTFQFTGLLDPEGTVLEANRASLDFAGLTREDVIGKPFWECYWWTVSQEVQDRLRESIQKTAQGDFIRYEVDILNSEGVPVPIDFSLKPIRDDSGQISLLVPEGRIITEQVATRTELEQLYEATFEQAAVGMAYVDESGNWLRLNEKFCEILGYSHDELMAMSFADVTHPEDFKKDQELFRRLKAKEIPSYTMEKRYIRKDGSMVWINFLGKIVWDSKGRYKFGIVVVQDISERKKAESNLRLVLYRQKLAAKLGQEALSGNNIQALIDKTTRLLLNALQVDYVAVLERDPETGELTYNTFRGHDGNISGVSVGTTGFNSQVGYTLLMDEPIVVEDFSTEIRFTGARILREHGIQSGMSVVINGSSPESPFGVLAVFCTEKNSYSAEEVPFLQAIANILSIAIGRQESERRIREFNLELEHRVRERTEQLEKVNQQKSRILALVSHDFKTPLAAITRFVELLEHQAEQLNPEQTQLIRYIGEGTQQLRNLVTDILDRARVEAGQIKPLKENIDVGSFVQELLPPLRALAEKSGIRLETDFASDSRKVHADPILLRQVLINLISNGIKYNQPEGTVFIRAYPDFRNLQTVFEIEDTGNGIPQDKLDSIFSDFYRANAPSDGIEGTGLGLAFSKKLVELQGGTIEVRSREGVGSVFTVRLPQKRD